MLKKIVLACVVGCFGITGLSFIIQASEVLWGWEEVSSGIPGRSDFTYIYGVDGTSVVYAGTSNGLYRSKDLGKSWQQEDLSGGKIVVTGIVSQGEEVIVSTENGLYRSAVEGKWEMSAGKKGFKGIASNKKKTVVWTRDDLFFLNGDSLERTGPAISGKRIEGVTFSRDLIYAAYEGGIYYSSDIGESWNKYFISSPSAEEVPEEAYFEEDKEELTGIRKINPDSGGGITVATVRDILIIDPANGLYRTVDTTGLPSRKVMSAINVEQGLFALTSSSVFFRRTGGENWQSIFENTSGGKVSLMDIYTDNRGQKWMWIACGKNIYRKNVYYQFEFAHGAGELERKFMMQDNTPSIREVQAMAIAYAEVSPDKISSWRTGARWKAILPKVSVGFSESVDDNVEIYKSASKVYTVTGPREKGNDWDVDLSWDLSDLIWNDAQTSIDTRSKLMVQLRDDLLEEVTRLYFERKRLIAELEGSRLRGEDVGVKQLRIEEVTGYIDALTGGVFTEAIESH